MLFLLQERKILLESCSEHFKEGSNERGIPSGPRITRTDVGLWKNNDSARRAFPCFRSFFSSLYAFFVLEVTFVRKP